MNNYFIIGCGFTKAVDSSAPTNIELLDNLIASKPKGIIKDVYDQYLIKDIEILLTKYDADCLSSPGSKRNEINTEIAEYFKRFRYERKILQSKPWIKDIAKIFSDNDVIVNLNYDCFIEGLLDDQLVWTPNGGYCRHIHCPLTDDSWIKKNPKNIMLFKIHGSENFKIDTMLGSAEQKAIGVELNPEIFPFSCASSHFGYGGNDAIPYIIAPSYVKIPQTQILLLMIEAIQRIAIADNLIIIGCGLRLEDSYLWLLITRFFYQKWDQKKVYIIDPKADILKNKFADFFSHTVAERVFCEPGLEDFVRRNQIPWSADH